MSQLLLERIETPSTVEEVDRVTVAEQVSVNRPLQANATSRLLDDLIGSLLGDVPTTPRRKRVAISPDCSLLSVE